MAIGWAGDGAVHDQIRDSIEDEVKRVQGCLPKGKSLNFCELCDEKIPEVRRNALPGIRLCIECQQGEDVEQHARSPYNRRGSKDSQLR